MQPDGGLAGAGGALDAERVGQSGPDDPVLLRLDGGHDVAHRAGPGPLDLGLEDLRLEPRHAPDRGEVLVLVRGQLAVGEAEPAARPDAHRFAGSSLVEGQRHLGPPVDHQRFTADLAGDVTAADVEGLVQLAAQTGVVVEATEEQRHGRVVLERLHPPVEDLLQVLGGDVIGAEGGEPGGVRRASGAARREPRSGAVVRGEGGSAGGVWCPAGGFWGGHAAASDDSARWVRSRVTLAEPASAVTGFSLPSRSPASSGPSRSGGQVGQDLGRRFACCGG